MITEQQRQERKKGIFSSDVPRVMVGGGVEVFLEKLGEREPEDIGELEYVQLGQILEEAAVSAYEGTVGVRVQRHLDTRRHERHSWLGAHLDALGATEIVEAKAVGVYNRRMWGEAGSDEVPDRVLWQVQAQMAVYGSKVAHVPAAFATEQALTQFITSGTVPITLFIVPRSEILIADLIDKCGNVWGCVESKIPPLPEKPTDARLLYTKDTGEAVEGTIEHVTYCAQRDLHTAEINLAQAKRDEIDCLLQMIMKDASELRVNGKTIATWKRNKDSMVLDADALKKAHPALHKQFTVPRPGARPFLVK